MSAAAPAASPEPPVFLVAACGFRVSVPRRTAAVSGLLRAMLSSSASAEAAAGEVNLPEISKEALVLVVSYMAYKRRHSAGSNGAAIPDFPIPPESALELLVGECEASRQRLPRMPRAAAAVPISWLFPLSLSSC